MRSFAKLFKLFVGTATIVALLVACGGGGSTPSKPSTTSSGGSSSAGENASSSGNAVASTDSSSKPYEGERLVVYMANHPWVDLIKSYLPEFEEATGIEVEIQNFADDQLSQKVSVQLTTRAATPDVFMMRPLQEARMFYRNGFIDPLNEYIDNDADYDFGDISKSAVDGTVVDGQVTAIPIVADQHIMYYRKDLLEKAGLQVPQTLEELGEAVRALYDEKNGIYGFVARGQRSLLVPQVSSFVFSEGGDFMKDGKAAVNTPEAVRGFKYYSDWLREFGPPGVMNMSWPEAMGLFTQGKAAFFIDASSLFSNAIDEEKSVVADSVGFGLFPAGSHGSRPYNITAWGMSLNANAKNKDAAMEFMKWATSKEIMTRTQTAGVPGVRESVWANPATTEKFPAELVEVLKKSQEIGVGHDRPQVISVGEARDIIGEIVQKAIVGEDIQAAADAANEQFQALIDRESTY